MISKRLHQRYAGFIMVASWRLKMAMSRGVMALPA
jgi:hypothetical protein